MHYGFLPCLTVYLQSLGILVEYWSSRQKKRQERKIYPIWDLPTVPRSQYMYSKFYWSDRGYRSGVPPILADIAID